MQKSVNLITKKKPLKIRLANNKDIKFTLDLHNKNVEKKKFFSKKKVLLKNHKEWFKKNKKTGMFFIGLSRYRIGYVRYDYLKKNNLSVSIAIKEKYERKGFGKIMLTKSLKKNNIKKFNIFAFIKNDNLSSKKFFLSVGFIKFKKNVYMMKALKK